MNKDNEYTVIAGGLTILKHNADGTTSLVFTAGGAVYYKTGQHLVLAAEAIYAKHADEISAGMDDFAEDMMKLGLASAKEDPKVQSGIDMVMAVVNDEQEPTAKQRRRREKQQRKR